MATNSTFARPAFGAEGGHSWADEDDLDLQQLSLAPQLATVDEPKHQQEAPREQQHRNDDRDQRGAREGGGGYLRNHRVENFDDQRGGGYRGGRDDHEPRPKNPIPDHPPYKAFVGNLPFNMNEDDLADFLRLDSIIDIRFPVDFDSNRPKGFAYVEFSEREDLVRAVQLDGAECGGRRIKVDPTVERERKSRQSDNNSWFSDKRPERRDDSRRGGRGSREGSSDRGAPRERPRLTLMPRQTSTEGSETKIKPSIFGEAKPRDEAAYLERQKAREAERKKELEEAKAKKEHHHKEHQHKEHQHKEHQVKEHKEHGEKFKRGHRKNSHDDATHKSPVEGGRGHGAHRGGRGGAFERGHRKNSHDEGAHKTHVEGGRGHGHGGRGGAAGRGAASERGGRGERHAAASKKDQPEQAPKKDQPEPSPARKEPRAKRTEPVKAKLVSQPSTKIENVFNALGGDSDSD